MKTLSHSVSLTGSLLLMLLLFSGCEHDVSIGSTVHPDGRVDRTILLHDVDSAQIENNFFGINRDSGWDVVTGTPSKEEGLNDARPKVNITFRKQFASVEEANEEMNSAVDTFFHIASSFQKNNLWFYTYIEYQDTYKALNLFNAVPKEDYFTKEDFAFIDRLPAEGTTISGADSLYLAKLNEKIFDLYGSRTIFEELFGHVIGAARKHDLAPRWIDTLTRKKEQIYEDFVRMSALEDEGLLSSFDKLSIPLPPAARQAIQRDARDVERRLEFMSKVYSGKYVHSIQMPWTIVDSNADSVVSNRVYWRPPVLKFLLTDYSMSAKSRRLNLASVAISVIVVLATVALFIYTRKRATHA